MLDRRITCRFHRVLILAGTMAAGIGLVRPEAALGQGLERLKDTDTLPFDPQVKQGTLPNGFRYFIRKSANPKGKAEFRLVVNAGHLHEDPDQLGLAHLLEHMAFNGTRNFPGGALREYFDNSGLQPGNDWNASTGIQTIYNLTLPVDKPALYLSGYQIMRDWAQDLTLEHAQVDDERGVVLGESRGSEEPSFKLMMDSEALILDHPKYRADYKVRHDENIKTFKYPAMERFLADWYRPDLEALIVVGDIDIAAAEQTIIKLFSDLETPASPRPQIDLDATHGVQLTGKDRFVQLDHPSLERTSIQGLILRKAAMKELRTVGDYRRDIQDRLFKSMVQARTQQLGKQYSLPYESLYFDLDRRTLRQTPNLDGMTFRLSLKPTQAVEPALEAAFTEWERIRKHGFLPGEFEKAKGVVAKELESDRRYGSRDLVYRLIDHYVEGAAVPDSATESALRAKLLAEVKLADLNTMAKEWLGQTKDRAFIVTAPTKVLPGMPSEKDFYRIWNKVRNGSVAKYLEPRRLPSGVMTTAEVAKLPAAPKYTAVPFTNLGVSKVELPNGITLLYKRAKGSGWNGDRVSLTGVRAGGINTYAGTDAELARTAASIVREAGLGDFNKFELEEWSRLHDISTGPSIGSDAARISGSGKSESLELMTQMIYRYLTAPRRDSAAFTDWKRRSLEQIQEDEDRRDSRNERRIDSIRFGSANREWDLTRHQIEAANLERAHQIYREQFLQPGGFTFILTGEFNEATAVPMVVKYLAALPSARPNRTVVSEPPKVTLRPGSYVDTTYRGVVEKAGITLFLGGEYQHNALNEAKLEVLGKVVQIVMNNRLREKEGGTYSVGVGFDKGYRAPGYFTFSVNYDAAPERLTAMVDAAREEFAKLGQAGVDSIIYASAIARLNEDLARQKDGGFWADYLATRILKGGDWEETLKRYSLINEIVTHEMVSDAAKQYLRLENLMQFITLPERLAPPTN